MRESLKLLMGCPRHRRHVLPARSSLETLLLLLLNMFLVLNGFLAFRFSPFLAQEKNGFRKKPCFFREMHKFASRGRTHMKGSRWT